MKSFVVISNFIITGMTLLAVPVFCRVIDDYFPPKLDKSLLKSVFTHREYVWSFSPFLYRTSCPGKEPTRSYVCGNALQYDL